MLARTNRFILLGLLLAALGLFTFNVTGCDDVADDDDSAGDDDDSALGDDDDATGDDDDSAAGDDDDSAE